MSAWVDGYRAALADVGRLSLSRRLVHPDSLREKALTELLADLAADALVIEREQANRIRRRRLRADREAMLPLDEVP
jgi:hypothetical protein